MNPSYSLLPGDISLLVAMLSVSAGFSIYWFHATASSTREFFFQKYAGPKAWVSFVTYQRFVGVVFLGVLPAIAAIGFTSYSILELTVWNFDSLKTLMWTAPMSVIIIVLNYFATRQPTSLATYPQMRLTNWNFTLLGSNSLSWLLYLIAYEFLFRGVLFVICLDELGFWQATAINIACYAITHIPKGARETTGTFIYGLVLCIATYETGSIFVAVVTHLVMALSNDYFSIYRNPEMRFSA